MPVRLVWAPGGSVCTLLHNGRRSMRLRWMHRRLLNSRNGPRDAIVQERMKRASFYGVGSKSTTASKR
jgi:hypothetical protein